MDGHRVRIGLLALVAALTALPAYAQIDFSGEWAPRFYEDQPERVPGPELFDYAGIPINDADRARAAAWEASIQTLPEWQCRPHSADYIWRGPSPLTISKEIDPVSRDVTAFHAVWLRSVDRAVYLDNRPAPAPEALNTWAGFTKASWQGGYGNMVELDHGNGLITRYGHLSRIDVEVGDKVSRGQLMGLVGSTGRSTGPHLHYEIRLNEKPINPRRFLPPEPVELAKTAN